MTQEISSLMDGELEAHEAEHAIKGCCASEEGLRKWQEYHLIGEAMRGHAPQRSRVADRVIAALGSEPTVLAPKRHAPRPGIARIALAAAASVATVAVVGFIGFKGAPQGPQVPQLAKTEVPAASAPAGMQAVAHSTPVISGAPVELHEYLAAHRQVPSPDYYRTVTHTTVQGR